MRFFELLEALEPYYATSYHGTGISEVKNIIGKRQGLQPNIPRTTSGTAANAVYLTPNIKLAARYSLGGLSNAPKNRIPAIIEIKLFGSRRYNNMQSDPLDRDDTAWQNHVDSSDSGSDDREHIRELENEIEEFIKDIAKRYKFQIPEYFRIDIGEEVGGLQGFPLYQYIHSYLAKLNPQYDRIRNDVSRFLTRSFSSSHTYADGMVAVTQNGVLQLTPDYWGNQHQNLYTKPIPASAIKAVWVRKKDFPQASGKEEQFGAELLPSEVVDKFETIKDHLEGLGEAAEDLVRRFMDDQDDKDYYVGELEELKKDLDDDELIEMLDKVIAGLDDPEEFDFESVIEELQQRGQEMAGYLHDEFAPGSTVDIEKDTVWVRVDVKDVGGII